MDIIKTPLTTNVKLVTHLALVVLMITNVLVVLQEPVAQLVLIYMMVNVLKIVQPDITKKDPNVNHVTITV